MHKWGYWGWGVLLGELYEAISSTTLGPIVINISSSAVAKRYDCYLKVSRALSVFRLYFIVRFTIYKRMKTNDGQTADVADSCH